MRLALALLLSASTAAAQSPDEFAWQWPLATPSEAPVYQVHLDDAVFSRITREDLRDVAVFNADGEPVPFAPLPVVRGSQRVSEPLRWLRVPVHAQADGAESLALRLERDDQGRVAALDVQMDREGGTPALRHDLLVDRGEGEADDRGAIQRLRLELDPSATLPVNLRLRVQASDDLATWQDLGRDLAFVALEDNGLRIEHLSLAFSPSHARYLRLAITGAGDWPALSQLWQERDLAGEDTRPWRELVLTGTPVDGSPGTFEYTSPGPLPVERVDVRLPSGNSVAGIQASVERDAGGNREWWEPVVGFTAFRLGSDGDELRNDPAEPYSMQRARTWRIETRPAMASAPPLVLGYRAEPFVFLAQGPGPYVLMAGSARARRPDYPVDVVLGAEQARQAPGWTPVVATLGEGQVAAGDEALSPLGRAGITRWLLWGVLAIGATLVLVVSVRVLRQPAAE